MGVQETQRLMRCIEGAARLMDGSTGLHQAQIITIMTVCMTALQDESLVRTRSNDL